VSPARLTAKIALVIVLVLVAGFGISTVWTIRREQALLLDQNKDAARRLTEAVVASIESAMLQERPDVTRVLIQEMRSTSPVEGLDVFRRNGVEAFSDLATLEEVEKAAGLPKEVFAKIQSMKREPTQTMTGPLFTRAVETLETQEAVQERDGVPLFVLYRPLLNQEKCQGCHGSEHRVRAVVRVATSMAPVLGELSAQRNRQILIGALTILAAGGVLAAAMRQLVVRPIQGMAAVARRIGSGDFEARVAAPSRDEIGQLGQAINDMTGRLAHARNELAARNTELATALTNLQASRRQVELLEQLKGELSKFVPDAVKELLERNPDATELEKRREEVSVLFLDIAGYTRLAEELDPQMLNTLVQTYFSSFLEIIRAHHGDVNETAGDGLMVIFQRGAPGQRERGVRDHALDAVRAALEIRRRTGQLNEQHAGRLKPIELHMGINSGEALVGATKLGGAGGQRWTFTASGPTTNLAARIAASAVGGEIVVGPETAIRIRDHTVLADLGERSFKNVSAPIRVYRVVPPGVYAQVE
jgi:class 3 adenylate cyclase/HAMP domain-containing protein